ncbi:MAG: hypothetical protein JO307_19370 [Bryobacterales bacterium]|nr:hypothetical protein [Bryobacterales bacterium]
MLRFDNLSGDASLDWIANVAPAILSAEWNGVARTLALAAGDLRDGYLKGATRFAHGYFEKRGGKLEFRVLIEDTTRHKNTAEQMATGDPLGAMNTIARQIEPGANAFSTNNLEAVDAWGHANFERAVTLDPDFSAAWLTWVETLAASGNSEKAIEVGARALNQSGLRSPTDRERIKLLIAGLKHDENGRAAALQELSRAIPFDAAVLRGLADAELVGRRFGEAERAYQDLIRLDPADPAPINTLGYVQALSGQPDHARLSFEEYGKRPGQAINALDSLGEAMFLNGKFAEAEKAFLQGYQKCPTFLEGADLWKAAHARWLGGDLSRAEQLAGRYFEARTRAGDPLVIWRRANWLYETGRQAQAVTLAMQASTSAPAPVAALLNQQLAIWKDPAAPLHSQSLQKWKQLYERANPVADGLERTFYASALSEAGEKDEARKLVTLWPLPQLGNSPLESLIYPAFLELKKQ